MSSIEKNSENSKGDITVELKRLKESPLTSYIEETGHFILHPQRSCFLRCSQCINLSEADSFENNGRWEWCNECLFCVQRVIDMLGYYEHKIVPTLSLHDAPKTRKRSNPHDIYELLERAAERGNFDV